MTLRVIAISCQASAVSRQPSAVIKHVAPQELLFLPGHDVERTGLLPTAVRESGFQEGW
ncbi:MAG TPA: hypothetical protein VIJ00_08345 [Nakamurella sp.]